MPAGCGSAGDDGESNANTKGPANLEDGAKGGDAERGGGVDCEAGDGSNTGEDVEEDPGSFGHAFSEDSWTAVFEVQFSLRYWLGGDDMAGVVLLHRFGSSKFHCLWVSMFVVPIGPGGLQSWVSSRSRWSLVAILTDFLSFWLGNDMATKRVDRQTIDNRKQWKQRGAL